MLPSLDEAMLAMRQTAPEASSDLFERISSLPQVDPRANTTRFSRTASAGTPQQGLEPIKPSLWRRARGVIRWTRSASGTASSSTNGPSELGLERDVTAGAAAPRLAEDTFADRRRESADVTSHVQAMQSPRPDSDGLNAKVDKLKDGASKVVQGDGAAVLGGAATSALLHADGFGRTSSAPEARSLDLTMNRESERAVSAGNAQPSFEGVVVTPSPFAAGSHPEDSESLDNAEHSLDEGLEPQPRAVWQPVENAGVDRTASAPAQSSSAWTFLRAAAKRFGKERGKSANAMPKGSKGSRDQELDALFLTQQEIQLKLEAREERAAQVVQRGFRCHTARTVYQDEHFVQREYPATVIVNSVKMHLARRVLRYKQKAFPSVVMLKNNWRAPLARRKVERMKLAKKQPKVLKAVCKHVLSKLMDEWFEPACFKITNDWASDTIGRAYRCNLARKVFWARFDLIDQLENDIGLEMTAPLLIQSMADSLKWAEVNAAAAKLQSCLRVADAIDYRNDLQDYDDYVSESATMIQCAVRCWRAREKVLMWDTPKCNDAALVLQMAYRCGKDKEKFRERKIEWEHESENAVTIQTQCRIWLAKQRFFTRELDVEWPPTYAISSKAALTLQRVFRGHEARDSLRAYVLSKFILMSTEQEVRIRAGAQIVQQAWRCHLARREHTITAHNSYSVILHRIRSRRRAALIPKYESLVIQDEEAAGVVGAMEEEAEEAEGMSDGRSSRSSSTTHSYEFSAVADKAHIASRIQAVYRAHVVRAAIRTRWGWDHREVSQALMVVWHRKMATKKIQNFWRGYRVHKRRELERRERMRRLKAIEDEFKVGSQASSESLICI